MPNTEYEEYTRGRVSYNTKTGKYTMLTDRCVVTRKSIVKTILRQMHPPKETEIGPDLHYRCFKCLEREAGREDSPPVGLL